MTRPVLHQQDKLQHLRRTAMKCQVYMMDYNFTTRFMLLSYMHNWCRCMHIKLNITMRYSTVHTRIL